MRSKEDLSISKAHLLDICANIEEMNARLYHLFADQSEQTPEIQKMWRQTALEEEEHVSQFRLGARLRGEAIEDVNLDESQALRMLAAVTAILEKAQANPLSYEHALRLSIQMEEKLSTFHMNSIATFCDEHCTRLFRSMMACDNEHIARLSRSYDQAVAGH